MDGPSILLTNTVCQIHPAKTLQIQVMNLSQALVILQSHQVVCVCEELEEEATGVYQVVVVGDAPCLLVGPPVAPDSLEPLQAAVQLPPGACMMADEESQLNLGLDLVPGKRAWLLALLCKYQKVFAFS